jgi:hypothetical protein
MRNNHHLISYHPRLPEKTKEQKCEEKGRPEEKRGPRVQRSRLWTEGHSAVL